MKKTKLVFAVLASLFLGACSSDNSDNSDNKQPSYTETAQTEAPAWGMDWSNNQERPDWTEPDFPSIYENWTVMKVQIEKTLEPYTSEGDLLALFVNGELRGLAGPAVIVGSDQVDNGKFVLKVWGNETGNETVNMSLQYYNQTLKHVFTLSEDISMNSDETTGIDNDFVPEFTKGSAKYPITKTVTVEPVLNGVGLTPAGDNPIGAFVGEECRGTATLSQGGTTHLTIYGRSAGESVTLKYYDAAKRILYTIPDAVKM